MNEVKWKKRAFKQMRKIASAQRPFIVHAVETLADWPSTPNVKKLTNHTYPYRLRAGNYRVFFSVEQGRICVIHIEEVKKRDNRTY